MKRNRILAIGIALLLAVQLLVPLACAAGATLKFTAPDKLPEVGQTFTVTVDLSGNTGLCAVQIKLGYDDSIIMESIVLLRVQHLKQSGSWISLEIIRYLVDLVKNKHGV